MRTRDRFLRKETFKLGLGRCVSSCREDFSQRELHEPRPRWEGRSMCPERESVWRWGNRAWPLLRALYVKDVVFNLKNTSLEVTEGEAWQ